MSRIRSVSIATWPSAATDGIQFARMSLALSFTALSWRVEKNPRVQVINKMRPKAPMTLVRIERFCRDTGHSLQLKIQVRNASSEGRGSRLLRAATQAACHH